MRWVSRAATSRLILLEAQPGSGKTAPPRKAPTGRGAAGVGRTRRAIPTRPNLLLGRWARFAAEEAPRPGFVIRACALIQSPVTELLLFADWSEAAISAAEGDLLGTVDVLDPALVLLRAPDIEATLAAVAAERADGAWRVAAEAYVADSAVGARRHWRLIDSLRWRAAFTDPLLPQLAADRASAAGRPDPTSWPRPQRELDRVVDGWLRCRSISGRRRPKA